MRSMFGSSRFRVGRNESQALLAACCSQGRFCLASAYSASIMMRDSSDCSRRFSCRGIASRSRCCRACLCSDALGAMQRGRRIFVYSRAFLCLKRCHGR